MNQDDELFIAKKTAERAGYTVTMPRRERENRFNSQPPRCRISPLMQAKRTAEEAGFCVRPMTPIERAKKTVEDAGYSVRKMQPEERVPRKDDRPKQSDFPSYVQNATKFMPPKED